MGVDVEVKPIDWDSKDMELSSGKIDVIWNGFSITDERRPRSSFSLILIFQQSNQSLLKKVLI